MKAQANGNMIMLAGQARGLTQIELAKMAGLQQGSVSKIEQGTLHLSDEALQRLADALNLQAGFFVQQYGHSRPVTPFHRSRKRLSVKKRLEVESTANLILLCLQRLAAEVEIPDGPLRISVDEQENSPEEIAFKVRKRWKVPPGPIDNVVKLLEDNGIFVVNLDFGTKDIDAFTLVSDLGVSAIFVNSNLPGDRLRWSLCHELGHIVMHEYPTEECEPEANAFASEFLMPQEEIFESLEQLSITALPDLKRHWKVSMWSIIVWASKIGAITPNRYRKLCETMVYGGFRTKEPDYLQIPKERPSLMHDLAHFFRTDFKYESKDLAAFLYVSESDLISWNLWPREPRNLIDFPGMSTT